MVVIIPFLYVMLSIVVAFLGRHRMFGFWGYFFCSLLLTPILGLLFVIASGKPPCRRSTV
ncbi:MAG: hypothetical protein ACYDH9_16955 [Limisphaerales bacterium]